MLKLLIALVVPLAFADRGWFGPGDGSGCGGGIAVGPGVDSRGDTVRGDHGGSGCGGGLALAGGGDQGGGMFPGDHGSGGGGHEV